MSDIPDVDPKTGKSVGYFTLVCDQYKCELVDPKCAKIATLAAKHDIDGKVAKVRGLAVTQMPTEGHFISKKVFNEMLRDPAGSLVGKPIADRHGWWPWDEISVAETLGIVTKAWYSDDLEALLFEAEIWDQKAIKSIQTGTQNLFSIAYYYDYTMKNKRNWYDELEPMVHVTWMECNHLALLSDPQVIEAELLEDMEILGESGTAKHQKDYPHTSTIYSGETPIWGNIDKTRLPFEAFVTEVGTKGKKSTYKYPHHWITRGKMYLHRQGLAVAVAAAKGARSGKAASPEVFKHLNKHLDEITVTQEQLLLEFKDYLESLDYGVDEIIEWYNSDEYKDIFTEETPMEDEKDKTEEEEESMNEDSTEEPDPKAHSEESETESTEDEVEGEDETEKDVPDESGEEEVPDKEEEVEIPEEPEEVETPATETDEKPETEEEEVEEPGTEEHSANTVAMQVQKLEVDNQEMSTRYEAMKLERDVALTKQLELEDKIKFSDVEKRVDEMIRNGTYTPANKDSLMALYKTLTPDQAKLFEALSDDKGVSFEEQGSMSEKEEPKPKQKKFRKGLPGYEPEDEWKIK